MNKELHAIILPNGFLELEWQPIEESRDKSRLVFEEGLFERFSSDYNSFFLFLGFCDKDIPLSASLDFWRGFTGRFAYKLSRTPDIETLRDKADIPLEEEEVEKILSNIPLMAGAEYINKGVVKNLWKIISDEFAREIKSFQGTVEEFIQTYSPNIHLIGRVFFHLVENKNSTLPFAFMATYGTALNKKGASKHLPLHTALKEYGSDNTKLLDLLSTVYKAASKSAFLTELLESGEIFHPLSWSAKEAFTFLKETPLYDQSGILCRIPDWWKGKRYNLRVNIRIGNKTPAFLGMNTLLDFNAGLFIEDTPVSLKEARQLLKESEGLAFIKNRWVPLDPERLKETIAAYENAKRLMESGEGLTLQDAMRMQLEPQGVFPGPDSESVEITNGEWLETVTRKLLNPGKISPVKPGADFKAVLREYQQKGVNWLFSLHSLKLGACLADDMGLGKTIQILAFLNIIRAEKPGKANLLIVPASLISNWINEIQHFSPALKYYVFHSSANKDKNGGEMPKGDFNAYDLVITTYALCHRYEGLNSHLWNYVILDEAQAIKNPGAKQTKAVKRFSAFNKIIMTGTPVENSLSDLWSLFDFLNPGLLGDTKEFKRFSNRLKDNPGGYLRLRKVTAPYILRRLKTDKTVISDLPDKVEMKSYASLSKNQVMLYQGLVDKLKESLYNSEGIARKGLILASLMKFKQICNHPDHYTGTGDYEEGKSGKFERLREICETIYEKREKVLIFTQFKEITGPLSEYLEKIFQRKGLVLHGSVPVTKRKKIVEQFQERHEYTPFMVLSLKAGGVGLNLTEANHVIHFDRWWNPAVENQATDRAFRIGQKKNVIVHKFITKGTIEEKIDLMLGEKSKLLAEVIHTTGETWITEMDNDRLIDIFNLTLTEDI